MQCNQQSVCVSVSPPPPCTAACQAGTAPQGLARAAHTAGALDSAAAAHQPPLLCPARPRASTATSNTHNRHQARTDGTLAIKMPLCRQRLKSPRWSSKQPQRWRRRRMLQRQCNTTAKTPGRSWPCCAAHTACRSNAAAAAGKASKLLCAGRTCGDPAGWCSSSTTRSSAPTIINTSQNKQQQTQSTCVDTCERARHNSAAPFQPCG